MTATPTLRRDCIVLLHDQRAAIREGTERRTREGRSKWEPIKILLKNSAYEPKITRTPPQTSLAKST
jgi:hypothetical protein